jgi:prepilin-type N-terminal cleavage/methylation domain-containing protein
MKARLFVAAVCGRRGKVGGHRPPLQLPPSALHLSSTGFTLLELLVVVALIAGLSLVLLAGLQGGGKTAALQSAQSSVAGLVTAARLKAAASGRHCRVLVANDAGDGDRYLRFLALQQARQPGASPANWDTVQTAMLPADTFVVPAALAAPAGLVADPARWKRVSDPTEDLVSGVFLNQDISFALEGDTAAGQWTGVCFTPNGTLARLGTTGTPPRGLLVIATGVRRPPGSYLAGQSPVQLGNPDAVRGLVLSAYGVPALLNDRSAF